MKKAIVLGGGGFIGSHLVSRLKKDGYYVVAVDIKLPEFSPSDADKFYIHDLRNPRFPFEDDFDEVYQLAADMGGAGYVFSGENDADILHNSTLINIHIAEYFKFSKAKIFFSSSACAYPEYNQLDKDNPKCTEDSVYPAQPDSEYGWEKIFSERLYLSYGRNYGTPIRIARFHNVFGPNGTFRGGKEKAPAALCRKVAGNDTEIEIWGDGKQTRSFLYIDECIEGIIRLMHSDCIDVVNIGSDEMVSINQLAKMIMDVAGKKLSIKHIEGPLGVRGRTSDNTLIEDKLGWRPSRPLREGIEKTYLWIKSQS